ncbi:MAG TPA: DUF2231 domain-containing protein [Isosphaeraceae bacterium]|jgi:uncharacterized membrane protein
MELLKETAATVDSLLGHVDAPASVSLPLAAWAVVVGSDAVAMATGHRGFDRAAEVALGAGLISSAGSIVTGLVERRSDGVGFRGHEAAVAGHVFGSLAARGLFAASFLLRLRAQSRGEPTPALARGLALAGGALALGNAVLTHRLIEHEDDAQGRARLDPHSPLGLRGARS